MRQRNEYEAPKTQDYQNKTGQSYAQNNKIQKHKGTNDQTTIRSDSSVWLGSTGTFLWGRSLVFIIFFLCYATLQNE